MAKRKSDRSVPEKAGETGKQRRAYTMSPAAKAQRQTAATKTGQHSQRAASVAPCKKSACPAAYPCEVKKQATATGKGLSVCLPAVASDSDLAARYLAAMDGDLEQLRPLAAQSLALQQQLFEQAGAELLKEGFGIRQKVEGPDGEPGFEKIVPHPAQRTFVALGSALGHTADHWRLTPKARGDEATGKGLVDLAEFFAKSKAQLAGGEK